MGSIGGSVNATIETATNLTIYNLSAPLASTEVSQALSTGTKKLTISVRGGDSAAQFSFVSTESSTKFITIPRHCEYTIEDMSLTGKTLYIQTDGVGKVIEILEWT